MSVYLWTQRHMTHQKWLKTISFQHFWLGNVLRARTACTFSTSNDNRIVKKWPEHVVIFDMFTQNVLRATTACTFSTSQLPKVVRAWCVLTLLTSKCASRHNGVQIFISHLASYLRTHRFSDPTFSSLRSHKTLEKHSVSRLSLPFRAPASPPFWLS